MRVVTPPRVGARRAVARRRPRRAAPAAGPVLAMRLREGRGWRKPRAPRRVELILQPIPLTLQ